MMFDMKVRKSFLILVCRMYLFFFFIMSEVHIAALNINGARNVKKRAKLFEEMEQKNIDSFFFLQETHSSSDNVVDWMKEYSGIPVLL